VGYATGMGTSVGASVYAGKRIAAGESLWGKEAFVLGVYPK